MKGLILAGGTGSRLRPITHTTQKQLIPLANKPVIQRVIENMKSAGITNIGVVLGGPHPGELKQFLRDGSQFGVDLTFIFQGEPLGLAHAVACAEDFVKSEPFLVYFGDTIIDRNIINEIVGSFDEGDQSAGFALQRVENPSRFGVVELDEGEIEQIHEKPEDPPSKLAYIGAVALTRSIFHDINELEPSWRGELELTQALDSLVQRKKSDFEITNGLWKDVGTPRDVIETNNILMDEIDNNINIVGINMKNIQNPVQINSGVSIAESASIKGPVIVGKNTSIEDGAVVGPYTSVGSNCVIRDAKIESSIVMDDVEIYGGKPISNSILSRGAKIESLSESKHDQFILGEDTIVRRTQ